MDRPGLVRCGAVRWDSLRLGKAGQGPVGLGWVWRGFSLDRRMVFPGSTPGRRVPVRYGMARPGWAWTGTEGYGRDRCVTVGSGEARHGRLRLALARRGGVRSGEVRFPFHRGLVMVRKADKATELGGESPTNGAASAIEFTAPYVATVRIRGTADILFHRWNCEAVAAKAAAQKGSKAKKTDDIESYVYRDDAGTLCIPGEYLRGAIIGAAKFKQDPRSTRKSAMDLYKAGIISLTPLATLGVKEWSYEHACRVQVQRNGVTRVRPAVKAGWEAEFQFLVNTPNYIAPETLNEVIASAGTLIGLADFRPTYGRYQVVSFATGLDE